MKAKTIFWDDTEARCDNCGVKVLTFIYEDEDTDEGLCGRCYGEEMGYFAFEKTEQVDENV